MDLEKPIEPEHSCPLLDGLIGKTERLAEKYNINDVDRDELMILAIAIRIINRDLRIYADKLIKYYEELLEEKDLKDEKDLNNGNDNS